MWMGRGCQQMTQYADRWCGRVPGNEHHPTHLVDEGQRAAGNSLLHHPYRTKPGRLSALVILAVGETVIC